MLVPQSIGGASATLPSVTEREAPLRWIAAAAAALCAAALTACSADEVGARAADVRSSADVFVSSARNVHSKEACASIRTPLTTVGSLAGRLAADPSLAPRLSPQVTAAASALARAAAGSSTEWSAVLDATGDLGAAVRDADQTTIRLTASQMVLAVRLAQAGCAVAGR
jgi:hypothetical protein